MEATFEEGQGPEGAVVPWMDGSSSPQPGDHIEHGIQVAPTGGVGRIWLVFWGLDPQWLCHVR